MSTAEQRLAANRANAQQSTEPATTKGKQASSRNATRHGLLSARLLLDDEEPREFQQLLEDLAESLDPVGACETALVQRIAVTLWRQRRLVAAETATLMLSRQSSKVAAAVSSELGREFGSQLQSDDLAPFEPVQEEWCRAVIAEIEPLGKPNLETLEKQAPLVYAQLGLDAEDDSEGVAGYLTRFEGGLAGYLAELLSWCRKQGREAEARPQVLALAEHVRAKHLVPSKEPLELFSRYQTTLDNQLYKALKALREMQQWRSRTIDAVADGQEAGAATSIEQQP